MSSAITITPFVLNFANKCAPKIKLFLVNTFRSVNFGDKRICKEKRKWRKTFKTFDNIYESKLRANIDWIYTRENTICVTFAVILSQKMYDDIRGLEPHEKHIFDTFLRLMSEFLKLISEFLRLISLCLRKDRISELNKLGYSDIILRNVSNSIDHRLHLWRENSRSKHSCRCQVLT